MTYLAHILASVSLAVSSLFGFGSHLYGTTVTTILGTDRLTDSRTTINDNFTALLNGKIENASSSIAAITTLSNLVSIGTITTGVWNATALTVPFGGTGSTTLSQHQVLLGNGTGAFTTPIGWGTTGQSLVSNGPNLKPTWQSTSFDTTLNYNVTGSWIFAGQASSTRFAATDKIYVGSTATTTIQGSTTGTSTFQGNVTVANNASTTNLTISGICIGCDDYTASSTTFSVSSGTTNYASNIPALANRGLIQWQISTGSTHQGTLEIDRQGLTSGVFLINYGAVGDQYGATFSWSGSTFTVTENTDSGGVTLSGTAYWYR